jgi:hypothetical protein
MGLTGPNLVQLDTEGYSYQSAIGPKIGHPSITPIICRTVVKSATHS